MSEHKITVEGGTSVRLPTAGKYCDRDIVVTATGGDTTIEDGLLTRTLTEYSNSRVTSLGAYALCSCKSMTSISFPNVTTIGDSSFRSMTALTAVNMPKLVTFGANCFYGCTKLTEVEAPLATSMGENAFYGCTALTKADYPLVACVNTYCFYNCQGLVDVNFPAATAVYGTAFRGCVKLEKLDFPLVTSILSNAFYNCHSLTALILRSGTMATLANKNALNYCYHFLGTVNATYNPDGLKDGYIYVPADLVDSYKAATNWSTHADQIRAIEDYPDITGG